MASKKILVQLDIQAAGNLTSPLSGFVGFSAKADGLYQKIGTAPELRLLTSADVQNAILADGSITGAVSQAQIFTLGVKLYNLTQGYIPFASGTTKLLANSPIYTDGTKVGIGTNNPQKKLQVTASSGQNEIAYLTTNDFTLGSSGSVMRFRFGASSGNTYSEINALTTGANYWGNLILQSGGGNVGIGIAIPVSKLHVSSGEFKDVHIGNAINTGAPDLATLGAGIAITRADNQYADLGIAVYKSTSGGNNLLIKARNDVVFVSGNSNDERMRIKEFGNVGIGTTAPNQQLEITKNFRLPSTTGTTPYGIIYKDGNRFIHDFNYGNNGTVTTTGQNTFVGLNAGNFTMGSTATETYHGSYNSALGFSALYSNTTGSQNSALGVSALQNNTTGNQNSALGNASLYSNTTGYQNSALGVSALQNNTTGNQNSALGNASLYSNTTGSNNSALGNASLYSNTTGSNNSALGSYAGRYIADGTTGRTTGNNGLYLGYNAKASADGTDNEIVVGYNAIGAGSNKAVIGNSSVLNTYFGSSTGASKLWASALNLSSLTASKVVFTDASKNLTTTGIGTASQFIKGDGSLDSNTYITSDSISGFVPYTGATSNVNLGTRNLSCNEISTASSLVVGNTNTSSYTDGGFLRVAAPGNNYAKFYFYSKDTYDEFGVVDIAANPEKGILLTARTNDNSSNSYLEIRYWEFGFYTSSQKRLEIAQNGSINAFGNTITSTGGFIGNASTATKLQTARTITIGSKSLSFDGTQNLSYTLNDIGYSHTRIGSNTYSYLSGDIVLQGSGKIFVNQTGQFITVNSYDYTKEDVGLGNVTNNAQWHNGNHPTTIAGYGITDALTVSGLSTNNIPKWNGTTFVNGPLTTSTNGSTISTNAYFISNFGVSAPNISLIYNDLNAGQSYIGYDRFTENGNILLIGAGYDQGYISILPENDDGLNVMVGSMSGARDLYVTGGTSTSTIALRSGAVTGYYLKCVNTNGTAEWAPVTASQIYKGTWNASTNTPYLSNGSGTAGWYYRVTTAGTFNSVTYSVGDDIIYNGSIWERIPGAGYSLQTATTTVLGGVKIDGTSVKLNASNQLYVSTNYEAPLTFTNGLSRTGNTVSFSGSLSEFVPYSGATQDVDLGSRRLTVNNICVTLGSGSGRFLMDVTGQGHAAWSNLPVASNTVIGAVKVGYGLYVNVDTGALAVDTMYFVPYTGATKDVNLGQRSIFAYDFVLYSDFNLKCNIESIPKHRIDIDYKQFEYKTNKGEKRYGVIAQELLSTAPEFVVKNGDYYAVKYTDLLVYEIVQLKEEIKELKSMLCR